MMEDGSIPAENGSDGDGSALIFLGTGCSSAVPNAMCLIQKSDSPCHVCSQSLSIPPERNPNYRGNTSLLIDYCSSDGNHNYIQIDVGKTFREQVLRWFTLHNIPQVDSIILTHEHADAVLGLDDIRSVQPFSPTNDIDPTPIFVSQYAMDSLAVKFPYLVQKKLKEGQEVRRVAQLDWRVIEEDCEKPFVASGLLFTPLPVMHGEDYVCLGFLFGEKSRVAYISDVSRFLPSTEYVISKSGGGQLDLLILDTLYKVTQIILRLNDQTFYEYCMLMFPHSFSIFLLFCLQTGSHNTHLCFPQTLETIKRLGPKRALLIGMTHEFDHHKDNEFLEEWSKREGISVKLAHDGLRVPIDL
ncbi:putative hydrolase C777.06c isoform X1 [Brassica napus]|uniref:putative hydrolase C777.06c isoform X1 n=1 Tax=Brassica napus TaxID=3708 RepID=UPI0020788A72|nr:putative hydrolase C777.06c isoform X1 [Brassica napus]